MYKLLTILTFLFSFSLLFYFFFYFHFSGYYADDTTEEWLEKLKSKQKNARPSTAEKNENEKLDYFEGDMTGSNDKFDNGIMSFNSSQRTVDTVKSSPLNVVPNSQMSTLRARHASEKNIFHTNNDNDNSNKDKNNNSNNNNNNFNSMNNSINNSSSSASSTLSQDIVDRKFDESVNSKKEDIPPRKLNDENTKRRNSISNIFEDNFTSSNNNSNISNNNYDNYNNNNNNDNKKNVIQNNNLNDINRYNQDNYQSKNITENKNECDLSKTTDLIDFLKELNGTETTVNQDKNKEKVNKERIRENDRNKSKEKEDNRMIEIDKRNKFELDNNLHTKEKEISPKNHQIKSNNINTNTNINNYNVSNNVFADDSDIISCKSLSFLFESSWGDNTYMGLSGIEILIGNNCEVAILTEKNLFASPKDLSEIGEINTIFSCFLFLFLFLFYCYLI